VLSVAGTLSCLPVVDSRRFVVTKLPHSSMSVRIQITPMIRCSLVRRCPSSQACDRFLLSLGSGTQCHRSRTGSPRPRLTMAGPKSQVRPLQKYSTEHTEMGTYTFAMVYFSRFSLWTCSMFCKRHDAFRWFKLTRSGEGGTHICPSWVGLSHGNDGINVKRGHALL
jgi:hypothetical protein